MAQQSRFRAPEHPANLCVALVTRSLVLKKPDEPEKLVVASARHLHARLLTGLAVQATVAEVEGAFGRGEGAPGFGEQTIERNPEGVGGRERRPFQKRREDVRAAG